MTIVIDMNKTGIKKGRRIYTGEAPTLSIHVE
jgi:hypothetical protein